MDGDDVAAQASMRLFMELGIEGGAPWSELQHALTAARKPTKSLPRWNCSEKPRTLDIFDKQSRGEGCDQS